MSLTWRPDQAGRAPVGAFPEQKGNSRKRTRAELDSLLRCSTTSEVAVVEGARMCFRSSDWRQDWLVVNSFL